MATREENSEMIYNVKRRYACPIPCDAKCVVEMTTPYVQVHIYCPCGCGWLQGWILLDEEDGGEQR